MRWKKWNLEHRREELVYERRDNSMAKGCKRKHTFFCFLPLNLGILEIVFFFYSMFLPSSTSRTSVIIYILMTNIYSPDCFSDLQNNKFRYLLYLFLEVLMGPQTHNALDWLSLLTIHRISCLKNLTTLSSSPQIHFTISSSLPRPVEFSSQ